MATVTNLSSDERETNIISTDGDDLVTIWTAQRRHISKLRSNSNFTETHSGFHGNTEWAEFTIPAERWNPVTGAKRAGRVMTPEEKEQASARLKRGRETQRAQKLNSEN